MRLLQHIHRWASKVSICSRIMIANSIVIFFTVLLSVWLVSELNVQKTQPSTIFLLILPITALGSLLSYLIIKKALQPVKELGKYSSGIKSLAELDARLKHHQSTPDTCQIANTLLNLIQQLETSNRQLRSISERAIDAQEDERRRIARWLHDDTGQTLLSLILNLEQLSKKLPADSDEVIAKISAARDLAQGALQGLREIIYGLRPSILDDLGLGPAIRWYANSKLQPAGIQAIVSIPDENLEISQQLRTSLFRIAQESINNIVHHSKAKSAHISLESTHNEIRLSIKDDGCGFKPAHETGEAISLQHWGLVGIQERCDLIGGNLALKSDPAEGTSIQVIVPIQKLVEVQDEHN